MENDKPTPEVDNPTVDNPTPDAPTDAPAVDAPAVEPQDSPKPGEDLASLNKQLFARTKKAEDAAKEREDENSRLKAELANKGGKDLDVNEISDILSALNGLDKDEQQRLQAEAKLKGKSLVETREDQDFKHWQNSYKVEKEKLNTPTPSTTQPGGEKSLIDILKGDDMQAKEEALRQIGSVKDYRKPGTPGTK